MTILSDIITPAYREANFKAQSQTLTAVEQSEGLALLQSLTDSLVAMVIGTRPTPWYIPSPMKTSAKAYNYPAVPGDPGIQPPQDPLYPPPNTRLFLKNTTAEVVYFQYQPEDGAVMEYVDAGHTATVTFDGNGMFFGLTGLDTTYAVTSKSGQVTRNAPIQWVFRGDRAAWVAIETLTADGEMPFPSMFTDYWVTALSIRLAPRFGNDPRETTILRWREMVRFIALQYRQSEEATFRSLGVPSAQAFTERGGYSDHAFGSI